jgi:SAM-dependent methyltransferase
MSRPATCGICAGSLRLAFPGGEQALDAGLLSPTDHRPGQHGDLYRCRECGTVQQPELPAGPELRVLYRDMHDNAYMDEAPGRRATAGRLLDRIGAHQEPGRLLDVGCGHGVLLDEARRRGYEVVGLELSRSAAIHARTGFGLDVRETALEDAEFDDQQFDAIVLADVIEHLDDPVGAIARCRDLLAPGGVLCVVTPDPSSLTARLTRGRWWGYLPAHTFLLPRLTLAELLSASGLVLSTDVPLVRTFSLRYWLAGLAERGGVLAGLERALARLIPSGASLSLSLGDERVMLAHRIEVRRPETPLLSDRGEPSEVHVVLPAYKAAETIPAVVDELPTHAADRALLVDDASPDETARVALAHGLDVLVHPANRGYGANQKTCYTNAALAGADIVVMVHADNQYDPALIERMVEPLVAGRADVVIGSRLLEDEAIAGGMPRWKWLGNRLLTKIENVAFGCSFSEYHTGYRAFSVEFLRTIPFLRNSDGFVFDQEIFAQVVAREARVVELAIPTRYFLEASSVGVADSVEYGLRTLVVLARFRADRHRQRWPLLRLPATRLTPAAEVAHAMETAREPVHPPPVA